MKKKGRTVTLRIKKWYWLEIAEGRKTREYRNDTAFYKRMLEGGADVLRLHYQGNEMLECDIVSIARIRRPSFLKDSEFVTTPIVFEITLKNPRVV